MVYVPNIPPATQKLRVSQPILRENSDSIDVTFGKNHAKFSDATGDDGKHIYTTFVNLTDKGLASPTTSSEELSVYVKDAAGALPRLFFRQPSDGDEIQLSGITPLSAERGYTFLPGGLLLQWGKDSFVGGASKTVTFTDDGGIAFTTIYNITMSNISGLNVFPGFNISAISSTSFTYGTNAGAATGIYWMAIGK